ncbi:hypothetical protein JIN86_13085 [Lysinibacillus sp. HST-98]|uniref:hypothetical protein n=1 Tax=Lysinibacillus TaxID=400634 RepID=UPI0019294FB8|nr:MULTISPECIES: hypothetical protein [Lysinibacillus]WHP42910.1 hypothetical protein QIX46_07830 [Lysinibacillus boronitolerans]MBL3730538.1 hypothetical protein [Lysinibacillus sp. HST-98]MBX8945538.1 hypothetical protein [Lysinibacillus sp. K60]UNT53496.1 hypothetical protein ICJ70_13155 [Lysinibacillus capsici]UUV26768.1 hypothetical protein NP781_09340 [Lysinibacillus sp. FN11]
MRHYLVYALLLMMIFIATLNSWGDTSKTVWYVIASISITCLMLMKTIERKKH